MKKMDRSLSAASFSCTVYHHKVRFQIPARLKPSPRQLATGTIYCALNITIVPEFLYIMIARNSYGDSGG